MSIGRANGTPGRNGSMETTRSSASRRTALIQFRVHSYTNRQPSNREGKRVGAAAASAS